MKKFICLTVVGLAQTLLTVGAAAQEIEARLVKQYHILERSLTLLVHHDEIIAGRTGTQSEGANFVESFDQKGLKMTQSIALPHSIRRLKAIDDCRVLVNGTEQFSVIDYCAGQTPAVTTRSTPANMVAHEGAALSPREFVFIEPNEGLVKVDLSGREQKLGGNISSTQS